MDAAFESYQKLSGLRWTFNLGVWMLEAQEHTKWVSASMFLYHEFKEWNSQATEGEF